MDREVRKLEPRAVLQPVERAPAIEFAVECVRFNAIAPGVANTPMNPVHARDFLKDFGPFRRLASG